MQSSTAFKSSNDVYDEAVIDLARYGIDILYQPPVEHKPSIPHNRLNTTPTELVTETTLLTTTNC